MKALFEVVILPVSDPDASLPFYRDQVGFDLEIDYHTHRGSVSSS
jgi:catechol 2,3-dioxygenase-like lactoylglutathione lyase family enzyme